MTSTQREQNTDVNSYSPDTDPAEAPSPGQTSNSGEEDVIPVPPDTGPTGPVEEPPASDGPPVGDVDDSPKRIS